MAYNTGDLVTVGQAKALAERVDGAISNISGGSGNNGSQSLSHETFTFVLNDGTTVTKEIVLWTSQM